MKAKITIGISGSGKSTWAREQKGFEVIERDSIRHEILLTNGKWDWSENFWSKWKFTKESEKAVTEMYDSLIEFYAKNKQDIICADTNLNTKYREQLEEKLESFGYEVTFESFPVDFITACERDEKRRDSVGRKVIYKQYQDFMKLGGVHGIPYNKKYFPDVSKPNCILVDIDGTLAHMNGKRGAFEWDKVGLDDIDYCVREFVNGWASVNPDGMVIVLSGRDGVCRPETFKWLGDKGINFARLIMREPNDMRKDSIVKDEIFWRDIADNYNVKFVIDDRPQVCRMWRELGLKVFQVGDTDHEF